MSSAAAAAAGARPSGPDAQQQDQQLIAAAAAPGPAGVLEAVRRLFDEPRFQDVHFACLDGRVVSSNRAFLAARCEYFERLLFGGGFLEAGSSEIRLAASSEAVRHVLLHLHTGGFGSLEAERCWITLMEASSLAQQYMLPGMVQHVAARLSADLSAENLGVALSHALKSDLTAVIKSIWVALPRLLQRPFALDSSFSADAICFCLQHTAWMAPLAASGTSTSANGGPGAGQLAGALNAAAAAAAAAAGGAPAAAAAAAAAFDANGTAMHRSTSINGASAGSSNGQPDGSGAVVSSRGVAGCKADSSVSQEAHAFQAVITWMLHEVEGCVDCQAGRHEVPRAGSADNGSSAAAGPGGAAACGGGAAATVASAAAPASKAGGGVTGSRPASAGGAPHAGGGSRSAGAAGIDRTSSAASLVADACPQHPAMLGTGSRASSRQQQRASETGSARAGTSAAALIRRLSSRGSAASAIDSEVAAGPPAPAAAADGAPRLADLDTAGVYAVLTVTPTTLSPAAAGPDSSSSSQHAATLASPAAAAGGADAGSAFDDQQQQPQKAAAADADGAPSDQQPEQKQPGADAADEEDARFSGSCCDAHEAMLLRMLAHLNWHLLEPSVLERLDSLALLGPAATLELYRTHQRCSHMALSGNFPSLSLGAERGLRCFTSGGEQVLECESVAHLTADANLAFTSGKHCWQFVVAVPCDLVWLGVSDGSLQHDVWGGKQPGGWFYGSNDALCHNKQSDRHAYTKHCGNGKWGEGAVVDVCVDMDAREVWFGLDGAEPRLGFSGLPGKVFPAISLRAPAQLLVRFRAASFLTAEWRR